MLKKLFCNIVFASYICNAEEINRISTKNISLSDVQPIYLTPGFISLILFPCNIISYAKGTGNDIDATLKEDDPKELHLWLKSSSSQVSNLIVRCSSKTFVFDVIPSSNTHQDFIQISSGFQSISKKVIASSSTSETTQNKLKHKIVRKLISSEGVN